MKVFYVTLCFLFAVLLDREGTGFGEGGAWYRRTWHGVMWMSNLRAFDKRVRSCKGCRRDRVPGAFHFRV